jgi:hypothetical protein
MENNPPLLDSVFLDGSRKIVVCKNDIELSKKNDNTIFILGVEESRGSAGGRIGGAGFRRINKISCYEITNGNIQKTFETENEDIISNFEVPLSAVAMDIGLSNGTPKVLQGVVDEELIKSYLSLIQ